MFGTFFSQDSLSDCAGAGFGRCLFLYVIFEWWLGFMHDSEFRVGVIYIFFSLMYM